VPEVSLSELLPQAFILFNSPSRKTWHVKGNVESTDFLKSCIHEVRLVQHVNCTEENIQRLKEFSKTAISDLIKVKALVEFEDSTAALDLFQFSITVIPLAVLASTKNLQEGYDWITFGLCDDLSANQLKDLEFGRLYGFMEDHSSSDLIVSYSVGQWIGDFYYICRCLSAMPDIAGELFRWSSSFALRTLGEGNIDEFLWAFSCIACWGANNHDEKTYEVVAIMERFIADDKFPNVVKHGLLVCLSTVASHYSSKPSHVWAQLALEQYSALSYGHQTLQFLMESCPVGVEVSDEKLYLILSEIDKVRLTVTDPVKNIQAQDHLSDMLSPFIGKCIEMKQGGDAAKVLKAWYNVASNQGVEDDNLLIIFPNYAKSLMYSAGSQSFALRRDIGGLFSNTISVSNRFLGISSSVGRNPGFILNEPDEGRFGVPDEQVSEEMEACLVEFYAINDVRGYLYANNESVSGMVTLPSSQHSIQYLFQKYTGHCWPIASSLLPPAEDREVRKVCMWCGAGSITEEIELNAVKSVLEKSNIQVDYFSSSETTKAKFINIYESNEYDVIWVMSHGEFDHWQPGEVSMGIGIDEVLSLNELLQLQVPVTDYRRLLFLNVCDGATYTNQGGIPKLGIAPSVAGSNQCTISHLWPVNPFSAAVFGCLYAASISNGVGFFDSFQDTLDKIRGTQDEVVSEIERCCQDGGVLANRLTNGDFNFELMAHSGSAVFFQ
jgi:hypothetical protein